MNINTFEFNAVCESVNEVCAAVASNSSLFSLTVEAAAATAVVTNAVVATCVVLVPAVAVGAAGVPVKVGDAKEPHLSHLQLE